MNIHLQEMKILIELHLAYVFDDKATKLKSSYGTGYRFPSLYETFYVWNSANNCNFGGANCRAIGHKKAETSQSYDFGIETTIRSRFIYRFNLL